jgi:uncharacterized protein
MNGMIDRILKKRLRNLPKSLILLGPRQVGKSTLCKELEPDLTINLASEKSFSEHIRDPGLLERILLGKTDVKRVLIDEVQRIPSILNSVQALIDDHGLQFFLSGSSARKLKKGQANLLPGRVFVEHLPPLVYPEISDKFDLNRALTIGTLPDVYLNDYGPELLDSYGDTYLREEIQAEALTKDLGAYARFIDLAAELSGQYINYSKIASDSEINKETIRRYFDILSETLIVEKIPSYVKVDKLRKARQREKFIFFDLGVRNAVLKRHKGIFSREEMGGLFEQWLILQCIYLNRLMKLDLKLSTYRDASGVEVDLIIEKGTSLHLVEVKSTTRAQSKYFKGMRKFEAVTGIECEKTVVYQGEHTQSFDGKEKAVPFGLFLDELISE